MTPGPTTGWTVLALPVIAMAFATIAAAAPADEITFVVKDRALHSIDPRLFGQFMERPSWGREIGPEAALVPGTHRLQPEVIRLLQEMSIPILRFPGGTDVDFLDWQDMIDNVPGRDGERPVSTGHRGDRVTNNFGYDEFLHVCEDLGAEAIVVVNLGDALLKKKPVDEAAMHAASLVAYCNAAVGADLPEGLADWPALRARNGRKEPYAVKYFQIGNETWAFLNQMRKVSREGSEDTYVECLVAYVEAMRAVDPSIRIIIDDLSGVSERVRERLGTKVQYLAVHNYFPWGISKVTRDGEDVPIGSLTAADIWYAWVATPRMDESGRSSYGAEAFPRARELGYKVAFTEWNWNGWWQHRGPRPALDSSFAKGVGAAGFLHALMRSGDIVQIGCQSMLVGNRWGITAIRVDPKGQVPPYYMPTGQVTAFYSKYHGDNLLSVEAANVPTYEQPYRLGGTSAKKKVVYVDALATASDKAVYFHAINRHFDEPMEVRIDLSAFGSLEGNAVHHVFEGRLNDRPRAGEPRQIGRIRHEQIRFEGTTFEVTFPPRTVSCIEIMRK